MSDVSAVRMSEIAATVIGREDDPLGDSASLDQILGAISTVGLACYMEGFALAVKMIELGQEDVHV